MRSHREIECSICGENLESREDISSHRLNQPQLYRVASCKFFPDCIDGEECFFTHENKANKNSAFCKDGVNCSDQSCLVSETNHSRLKNILCKFQLDCNRFNCTARAQARSTGREEEECILHLFQRLGVLLVKGNAALLQNRTLLNQL